MAMVESVDLLFFDTFAHENNEEVNLDLVQFPKPVFVTEVRIIPLGARVQADFPGGVRLGATNPTQFSIEFFVNDLGKPGASSFESLGGFEYNQNGCIHLECTPDDSIRKIPTDGLVLRGHYTTITLAVYGILTANVAEQVLQPSGTPTIPPQTNLLSEVQTTTPISSVKAEGNEWNPESEQHMSIDYTQQPTPTYAQAQSIPEQFKQEYPDYYTETPKDPRSFQNTPETDWDVKPKGRTVEHENRDVDRYQNLEHVERENTRNERDRNRHLRSHSQERDWTPRSRNYREANEWEQEYREHLNAEWEPERERNYKHQENYRRAHGRDDREDRHQKTVKVRTPPSSSPKRPHTPHFEKKDSSPVRLENLSDEDFNNTTKREKEWEDQTNRGSAEKVCSSKNAPGKISPPDEELRRMNVEEFEPILSDEDILDDSEHFQELDFDYTAYTNNDDLIQLFIPGTTPLQKYKKAPLFNITNSSLGINDEFKTTISIADDFFRSSITKYSINDFEKLNLELKEEFIHLCEKVMTPFGDEENFCHVIKLNCLTKDIELSKLGECDKEIITQVKCITDTLIEWIKIALNFEIANMQNQPPSKIRHIKGGIRLANFCSYSEDFIKLLWEHNYFIHEVLLNLYNQEYMALSIKSMILHALDRYLLHKSSVECFVFGTTSSMDKKEFTEVPFCSLNGYKSLIEMMNKNPSVRLKFALQSILKKLNLFEVLSKLHHSVSKLCRSSSNNTSDLNFITESLEQILSVYRSDSFLISQPKCFLPVSAQFEINRSETKNFFVLLFKMHHLIDCFTLLLSFPSAANSWTLKTSIFEIISELLLSSEGLCYLCDNSESLNILLKVLLQNEHALHYMTSYSPNILGLKLAYFVQCQYYVDYLLDLGEKHKFNCDISEVVDQLHALFCLTFSNIGKLACAKVLGFSGNLKSLLQFLDILYLKDKSEAHLVRLKRSVGIGYIVDLVARTIIFNSEITVLETCIKQLMHIINQHELFEGAVIGRIIEFAPFVKPLENLLPLNYSNITPIVEIVVKYIDSVTTFPGQLITALRILQHLGITKHAPLNENSLNNYSELKFKYVIIQLFANDGIALLTKILQKICDFFEQPSLHTAVFVSHQGVYIIALIEPCINLLHNILSYVIHCRNTNFKDITPIPVLLQTYNLLCSFFTKSAMYFTAKNLCIKLIDTLLVYTQPVSDDISEKDSLNKTLWALMCNEVIKYINWAPYTFISGLLIFSELLPLPLPIQTRHALTSEEISFAVNLRKLWAAHLHTFSSNIQEFINRLCTSNNPSLLSLLRKVCIQLADLAANSALMIARGILDTVYNALIFEENDVAFQQCTVNTARLLNLLACLVTHSSLKCAVLHLLHTNNPNISKGDEKYSNLFQAFAKFLSLNVTLPVHIQAQECILSIIQSLCDSEITLLQSSDVTQEVFLSNSVPAKDILLQFITIMLDHLMADNSFVTYLPIVRTLLLLTEHDYGFYHLREHLFKRSEPFLPLLNKLVSGFSNDSVDCLSTLNTLMELLRVFILRVFITPVETIEILGLNPRTMKMLPGDIKILVGWKEMGESDDDRHPLYMLEELLKRNIEDDKTFENYLLEGVSNVISILKGTTLEIRESYIEPVLPSPLPILAQFAGRTLFTLTDIVEEQITSMYWLSIPSDEGHSDVENVACDLIDICRQNLPADVNLIREIEKVCQIYPSSTIEVDDTKFQGLDLPKEKSKKTFATPTARRGFPRTLQIRSDVFRSRPPNTSRPPSLHVDDFVALETCGAQPTGPTGYNKISRELLATNRVTRGPRGRSFANSERQTQYRQMSWWNSGFGKGPY